MNNDEEKENLKKTAKEDIYEMLPKIKKILLENYFGKDQVDEYIESAIRKYVIKVK